MIVFSSNNDTVLFVMIVFLCINDCVLLVINLLMTLMCKFKCVFSVQ